MYQSTYTAFFGIKIQGKSWSNISVKRQMLEQVLDMETDLTDEQKERVGNLINTLNNVEPLLKTLNKEGGELLSEVETFVRENNVRYILQEDEKAILFDTLNKEDKPKPKPKKKEDDLLERLKAIREFKADEQSTD